MSNPSDDVLRFWFGDDLGNPDAVSELSGRWFASDSEFDESIRQRFGTLPQRALNGEFEDWRTAPRSCLALVLVLDQFPRNLFRGSAESFAYDPAALEAAKHAVANSFDETLHPLEAAFLYLPLEHAENLSLQRECVSRFRNLAAQAPAWLANQCASYVAYAEEHKKVIEQFGRFPHRNIVLGRESTAEELAFLKSGGATFSAPDESE